MKKFLVVGLLFVIGSCAFSDSGLQSRIVPNRSAIQTSKVNENDSSNEKDLTLILSSIYEVQKLIQKEPYNYSHNVSLIELYFQSQQYDKAYDELVFLNNLSMQNKLSENVKTELKDVFNNYKKLAKYQNQKYKIYIDFTVINLILNNYDKALACFNLALASVTIPDVLIAPVKIISDTIKDSQNVMIICNKVIEKFPENTAIRKLKAEYLLQENNLDLALEEYYVIIELSPSDIDAKYNIYKILTDKNLGEKNIIKQMYKSDIETAYYDIAEMLLAKDELENSKKYAVLLTEKFPDNAKGYILLSEIYKKENNPKMAYEVLAKARDKAVNNEEAAKYNVMLAKLSDEPVKEANSLIANNLYQQALDVLASANPEDLYVILTQARASYMLKKKQDTFEYLNKAMSIYPENSDVFCAFGYIYLNENDIESARKYVNESLRINSANATAQVLLDMVNKAEADKYINQIISAYEAENYRESMRLIEEALVINKKDSKLYYYKALNYIAQNNYAASTAMLYKAIQLDKNNIPAYFYLGLAFDNLSEPQNALMYYKQYTNMISSDEYEETERLNYAKQRISKLEK